MKTIDQISNMITMLEKCELDQYHPESDAVYRAGYIKALRWVLE